MSFGAAAAGRNAVVAQLSVRRIYSHNTRAPEPAAFSLFFFFFNILIIKK
jgi:hypothetical protein